MPKVPPTTLPILQATGMRTLCVADLNADGGSERTDGAIEPLTSYIASVAASAVNVITLQEMCANQYTSVQNALGSKWTGTFKRFGQMDGCHGRKHGLSIFTKGQHSDIEWWHLPHPEPDHDKNGQKWWGLLKVSYNGVDVYTTHIRSWDRVRKSQTEFVVGKVRRPNVGKAILAGDFNQTPDQTLIACLYEDWVECDNFRQPTIRVENTDKKIDYIWANWKPFQIFGGPIESPSNHRLVWAVIRWRP